MTSNTTPPPNPPPVSPPPYSDEDRRKHLDYIQAVIARLASGSNSAKGFSLTIAAAAFGFSALNEAWYLSLLGIAVIGCFSVLDMHYLYEERLFRCLFRDVVNGSATNYDMNKYKRKRKRKRPSTCANVTQNNTGTCTRWDTYRSWSVLGFYLPLLLTGLIVVSIALLTDKQASADDKPPAATSIATPTATTTN